MSVLPTIPQRQREAYDLALQGFTNREIAERMFVELHTVRGYLVRVRQALGMPATGRRRISPVPPPSAACLTARQRDVCGMARAGWLDREIAAQLGISPHTVKNIMTSARQRYAEYQEQEVA